MKKLLFGICFMLGAAVAVNAQDTTDVQNDPSTQYRTDDMNQPQQDEDRNKQEISTSELPAAVRASLESQNYSGWTVNSASKKEKDGETVYSVELSNGADTKKVKFDEQGNEIKKKKDKNNDY